MPRHCVQGDAQATHVPGESTDSLSNVNPDKQELQLDALVHIEQPVGQETQVEVFWLR